MGDNDCADDVRTRAESSSGILVSPPAVASALPAYMPIEQMRGESVGAEADTFALCVCLWEGLHGVRQFAGQTLEDRGGEGLQIHALVGSGRVVEPPADRPLLRATG
ncbi:MAG: hypothetical protein IPK80_28135 [Nannocystis sp.]|nr:hypothetical protein [Nannocystis sp.]